MGELPNAVVKRLLSRHGEGLRVSGGALDRAVEAAEAYLGALARLAAESARNDKRKTIMETDIDKARARLGPVA